MAALSYTSQDYFTLDGVSSAAVGLWVDTPPVPPLARQRYTTWKTGVDADMTSPDDVWEDITLSFSCYVFLKNDDFRLDAIYAFLNGKSRLQCSRFPNRFFKIRQVGGVTPAQQYDGNKIRLNISFVCNPFKYHTSNATVTPDANGIVTNPGTRYSRPVYQITRSHNGECTMTVNNQLLVISSDAPAHMTVDAERMIAYNTQNSENATKYTTGYFPFLNPGQNTVTLENCSVQILGNWRDY